MNVKQYYETDKIRRTYRKENGLCGDCGKPTKDNKARCKVCLARRKDNNLQRQNHRKKNGLCIRCGIKVGEGTPHCPGCMEKRRVWENDRMARRRKDGKCPYCIEGRALVDGKGTCQSCLDKREKSYIECRTNGVCTTCKKRVAQYGVQCVVCSVKSQANRWGTTYSILMKLWEQQGGRCAYTGRKLTLGLDASVDHRVPRGKGGTSDEDNLQWVHIFVNYCKWNLMEEEFFSICKDVVVHRKVIETVPTGYKNEDVRNPGP